MEPLKEQELIDSGSLIDKLKGGFRDRFEEGREDYRQAYYSARELQGKDPEDARIKTTLATNPTFVTARDLMNISEPIYKGQREERGMGLSQNPAIRTGQVLGTIGNDLTQDSTRSLWWLLNAAQATGNVINEYALSKANPDLFSHEETNLRVPIMESDGLGGMKPKAFKNQEMTDANVAAYKAATAADLISKEGTKRKGVGQKDGTFTRRKYSPGDVAALGIPTGIAINAGLGLLNPLGGSGGYTAVIPSDEDITKTDNAVLEVASKYFLGKTGNLLPYEQFKEKRH